MLLADQLRRAGLGAFPCRQNKTPAIQKGEDWREVATRPPETLAWPSSLVGVPVPPDTAVIDLDLYKGVTRESVEALLGCSLPWDLALLQRTQGGGEHYAFRVGWPVRHGSNLHGLTGFDTRVGGKGYICTGQPSYTAHGPGVFRLAYPASLPGLPDGARLKMEHVEASTHSAPADVDQATVIDALRHIPPSCDRARWIKVGMALRTWTDDPSLFERWSSGELAGIDAPDNYVPEDVALQWSTFKPTGGVGLPSLFYEAIDGGWRPQATINTAAAFGAAGTDPDVINLILEHGCDPRYSDDLKRRAGGNAVLLALLSRELKEAGLLTRPIRQELDALAGAASPPRVEGMYAKNHTENARLFLQRHYPEGGFVRSDQVWYAYNGRAWEELSDDDVKSTLAMDMAGSYPQHSNIMGTYNVLCSLCHRAGDQINDGCSGRILFQNGVLDLASGELLRHSPAYFTTIILPYDYNPGALAPRWLRFLDSVFEGDLERIALLQEWFGYMMSNGNSYQKILLLLGPARSGKGTVGRVLECVVGAPNFTGLSLHKLTSDPFINSLRTKTVAFSGDTARRVNRNLVDSVIERLKGISGNDAVTFDRKWKSTLSQTLPTRITIAGNHIPNLFDDSGALASRLLVLPFNVSFINREDLHLFDDLMPELAGIAAWAFEGLRRLTAQGQFIRPAASENEARYIAEMYSPLKMFKDEVCSREEGAFTSCADLHDAYRAWALNEREQTILPQRTFISAFKDATRGDGYVYGVHRSDGTTSRGFKRLVIAKVEPATAGAFAPRVVG